MDQRVWLLERDFDLADDRFDSFHRELRDMRQEQKAGFEKLGQDQRAAHEKLEKKVDDKLDGANGKLWWITGIGFTVLIAVIGVLIAALSAGR